ncbi:MAG TPA: hypothetical protein VE981_19595 [Planctomycetota bacterium]|nr:hypothetical protein [Planctomycetota bacterium]
MLTVLALALALALQDPAPFQHENTTLNLKQFAEKLHAALTAGDTATALALTNSVLPDEATAKKGLKDDVDPAFLKQAMDFYAKMLPADPAARTKLFTSDPAATEVQVYASTTEDLQKYEKGSVAFAQFPGGAKKLADAVLRPGMTYYEVTNVKPGEKYGMKFHLFYWTGERWSMLGPIWRALPK